MNILFGLLILLAVWLIFLLGPPWMCGFFLCRLSACWHQEDKIKKHVILTSPWLARLLIPRYIGFHSHIRTNIPLLYNRYYVNQNADCLSLLGLIDYCITIPLFIWYGICITAYFFLGMYDNFMIPLTVILFMAHALVYSILINWNQSGRREIEVITKQEWKQHKKQRH